MKGGHLHIFENVRSDDAKNLQRHTTRKAVGFLLALSFTFPASLNLTRAAVQSQRVFWLRHHPPLLKSSINGRITTEEINTWPSVSPLPNPVSTVIFKIKTVPRVASFS